MPKAGEVKKTVRGSGTSGGACRAVCAFIRGEEVRRASRFIEDKANIGY